MEPVIAVFILAIVASSTIFALISANRYVVTQRYMSSAKALCQERIDQALSLPLTTTVAPSFMGSVWSATATTAETETVAPAEDVSIYTSADNDTTPFLMGKRRTFTTCFVPDSSRPNFRYFRIRVRVEFYASGRGLFNRLQSQGALANSYEMSTLRSPD